MFGTEGGEWDGDELGGREGVGVVRGERGEGGVVFEDCTGGLGRGGRERGGEGEEAGGFFEYVAGQSGGQRGRLDGRGKDLPDFGIKRIEQDFEFE